MKHTPRLRRAHDSAERELCLSCALPECIPDHPACALHGDMESRKRSRGVSLCSQCKWAVRVVTDHPLVPIYFHCPQWSYNTMGWRKACSRFHGKIQRYRPRTPKQKESDNAHRTPQKDLPQVQAPLDD